MSIIGEYLRVTPAQLERAVRDPEWALDHADEVREAEDQPESPSTASRYYSTYKAWDLIRFLLARTGMPVDIIHGEEPFTEEDWGYGPPRYLHPEHVQLAAHTLRTCTYDQLIEGVSPDDLTRAEVYPLGWDVGMLGWGRHWYDGLTHFFEATATAGDAMLVWLD